MSELEQTIHNLRMTWPIGIRSIDDERDAKLKRLEEALARGRAKKKTHECPHRVDAGK